MKLKEKDIEIQILQWLNYQPGMFAFKVNTTGFFDTKIKRFRKNTHPFIIPGTSDILGLYQGRMFAIEVKTKEGMRKFNQPKLLSREENQKAFLDKVNERGGLGICVSSLDEVITSFQLWILRSPLLSYQY